MRAALVVAADGRDSKVARWARVPGRVKPHRRFFYWGYWRGLRPATSARECGCLDPDAAYTFPNEDDLTVVLLAPHHDRLPRVPGRPAGRLPAQRQRAARRPGPERGDARVETARQARAAERHAARRATGLAFVGDAALAADPLWGVGCGWAFQSADWLVQETAGALDDATSSTRRWSATGACIAGACSGTT